MANNTEGLSRGKKHKSMLDNFLELWELDYTGFAEYLGIKYKTLHQYRTGRREFKLNTYQIQRLQKLLRKIEKDFDDLPLDWYLDRQDTE